MPEPITIERIAEKVFSNRRIEPAEAGFLLRHPNLTELAALADRRRQWRAPGATVTYVVGRIVNYTNICRVGCKFCGFSRPPGDPEGYTLSDEEILEKVGDAVARGGVEILFQGGVNPYLDIEWYERVFGKVMAAYPTAILHALSPAEVTHLAKRSKLSLEECLRRLKAAGLHSMPGAGGEILVDRVRKLVSPHKLNTAGWLECTRAAARQGIRGTATMMFGHVETLEERVEHLTRIREVQDECAPFRAFICWPFQPEDTRLEVHQKASSFDYLRTQAVARIFLDNVDHVQLSILTQGPKIGQLALGYGADDFGSTMIEENVVSASGSKFILNAEQIERLIREAGYEPARRNTRYERV